MAYEERSHLRPKGPANKTNDFVMERNTVTGRNEIFEDKDIHGESNTWSTS